MIKIREAVEKRERDNLSPLSCLACKSKGRRVHEPECEIRTVFQHDRDRIIHSKAFRRLKYKTQVFISPSGDHYRTRLTHTLEVSQIARTIARALSLNEDLTEAVSLGHDLGHTPFGHSGERALGKLLKGGFRHEKQSIRVVDFIARNGQGLNLTYEVRNGILMHSKGKGPLIKSEGIPETLEGQIIRLSDIIAYINHDIDDALRGGFIELKDVPYKDVLGEKGSQRINLMVHDLVSESFSAIEAGEKMIRLSDQMTHMIEELRDFMFRQVYESPVIRKEFDKSEKIIDALFNHFLENYSQFAECYSPLLSADREQNVADFIASLTDSYAIHLYNSFFIPERLKFPDFKNED